ncbi:unnamed protein product [Jaminaea pallidilutea]
MPLEQIRPLLALETQRKHSFDSRTPRGSQDGLEGDFKPERSPTLGHASPDSPRTPIDGQSIEPGPSSSSMVGPCSPSIRSSKSLFHGHDPSLDSSERSQLSSPIGGVRNLDEGVTRSSSWKSYSSISVVGRGRRVSEIERDVPENDESYHDVGLQRGTSSQGPRSSLSRASTTGSQSSYSTAATSLRSLSTRNSADASFESSDAMAVSPTSSRRPLARPQEGGTPHHSKSPTSPRFPLQGSPSKRSSFSTPGLGRVQSIGRGSICAGSERPLPSRESVNGAEPSLSPLQQPQSNAIPSAASAPHGHPSHFKAHLEPETISPQVADVTITGQPEQASFMQQPDSALDVPNTFDHDRREPPPPSPQSLSSSPARSSASSSKISRISEAILSSPKRLHMAVAPSFQRSGNTATLSSSPQQTSTIGGSPHARGTSPNAPASSSQAAQWETNQPSMDRFNSRSPAALGQSGRSSPAHEYGEPSMTRRHTASSLRSKSAFSQQISTLQPTAKRTSATGAKTFYGAGHQGGRKAARIRARHPSLAMMDNAPFSVLEARRSEGLRSAAAAVASGGNNSHEQQGLKPQSDWNERPLSPMAMASPDAPRPVASFGSAVDVSDLDSQGSDYGGGRGDVVLASSDTISERDRASPSLVAAVNAAATAVGRGQAQSSPRLALRRQHSRPQLAHLDTDMTVQLLEQSQGSPSGTSSPRPSMPRSSTASSLTAMLSPPLSAAASASGTVNARQSPLLVASSAGTHVLRTPTTEEWARFLASQGVEPGQRTRTTTGRSLAGFAAQSRMASSTRHPSATMSVDSASAADSADHLRALSRSQHLPGSETDEKEDEVDYIDDFRDLDLHAHGIGSPRSRSSSSSSDSSQGRMEALHAAISMPPSRRGTPPLDSPPAIATQARARGEWPTYPLTADSRSETVTATDQSLGRNVQHLHSYLPAPSGRKRTINDFEVAQDIGRGAYGLVKLIRLRPEEVPSPDYPRPEFVVKYIIKSRILADCWRRHRSLGPIPVEIHVMDQLRRLPYVPPAHPPPWDPVKLWPAVTQTGDANADTQAQNGAAGISAKNSSAVSQTHPSLCTMLDFFEDESFYYLVMPRFGQGTDLFDYIESCPLGLATTEARCILGQVADGVRFLHEHGIVHRDIKDENVILDGQGHSQLIDFGSAAHVRPGRCFDTFSGTLDYAAAEILRGDKYAGKEQDVWALGVVAYVCLVGDVPFWNGEEAMQGLASDSRALHALQDRCCLHANEKASSNNSEQAGDAPTLSEEEFRQRAEDLAGQADGGGRLEDAMDLIEQCLQLDPEDRPTAHDVCHHVFLAGNSVDGSWRGPRGWMQ